MLTLLYGEEAGVTVERRVFFWSKDMNSAYEQLCQVDRPPHKVLKSNKVVLPCLKATCKFGNYFMNIGWGDDDGS